MLDGKSDVIILQKDSIITLMALDFIKEKKIKVIYQDEPKFDRTSEKSKVNTEVQYDVNNFSSELILQFYYLMLKIRFFEELAKAYKEKGNISGDFVHLYLGEEAIAVGVCCALKKEDYITSTHRGHGHMIAKGADISKMLAAKEDPCT